MSSKSVDLEIVLSWVPAVEGFLVTVLYNAPGTHDDYRFFKQEPIVFDLDKLRTLRQSNVDDYGVALGDMLFPVDSRHLLDRALDVSEDLPVHLRLVIDPKAPPAYQAIRWETLCHPGTRARLTTSERIRFSRFIPNLPGSGQPSLRARTGAPRALVAVANPADVTTFADGPVPLSPIAVADEVRRATEALASSDVVVLDGQERGRATRRAIVETLADGLHVLYLVCHGRISADERPEILLEDEEGDGDVVDGATFASDIGALDKPPTIVVLSSCQSAGRGDAVPAGAPGAAADESRMAATAEGLSALGPAFAVAGAAVVIGMQGDVTMRTAAQFFPRFFTELEVDGVPARAMAAARSMVRDRPDWYMPVLYSRLKRGSTWYLPRFGGKESVLFAKLQTRITGRRCTPVVGAGIAGEDGVLPSRQEVAAEWVQRRQIPMAAASQTDLASVAQFVRVEQESGPSLVQDELFFLVRSELRNAHESRLPDLDWDTLPLANLVSLIGEHRRARAGGLDAYSRLARLDLPVFVTTSWTNLLEDALEEQGKRPRTWYFDWRKSTAEDEWPYLVEEETGDATSSRGPDESTGSPTRAHARLGYAEETHREKVERLRNETAIAAATATATEPGGPHFTVEEPLVYHLFGTLQSQPTLVITEDDYFLWLREWIKQVDNGASIPGFVKTPLTRHSQLFLGYRFDDWEFRMVFQAIKSFQRKVEEESPHVGVQLEPEALQVEREAAQNYLESYFQEDKISVYWQTSTDFLTELARRQG
jgi:hypothetical protein